jgi:hypothetical protein
VLSLTADFVDQDQVEFLRFLEGRIMRRLLEPNYFFVRRGEVVEIGFGQVRWNMPIIAAEEKKSALQEIDTDRVDLSANSPPRHRSIPLSKTGSDRSSLEIPPIFYCSMIATNKNF